MNQDLIFIDLFKNKRFVRVKKKTVTLTEYQILIKQGHKLGKFLHVCSDKL